MNWKEKKKNMLKCKKDTCNECSYDSFCEWVWKEYVSYYWFDGFQPITK
jgi:hypothetical protein